MCIHCSCLLVPTGYFYSLKKLTNMSTDQNTPSFGANATIPVVVTPAFLNALNAINYLVEEYGAPQIRRDLTGNFLDICRKSEHDVPEDEVQMMLSTLEIYNNF